MEQTTPMGIPPFFYEMLAAQYSADDVGRIVRGCSVRRPVTLRANVLKGDVAYVCAELGHAGISWSRVAWYGDAIVLHDVREPVVRGLDIYSQGRIYLQSLSSMIPVLVLSPRPGADVLDMCAAPGGKTTQICAMTNARAHVTACEMHVPRAEKLEHNLRVQGASNVNLMRCDARRLDDFFRFDQILLDAPCSGSGTIDVRDPKMPRRFTEQLVQKSTRSQRALLGKAISLLKVGECLVYSTCSVLRQENEDVVKGALERGGVAVEPIDPCAFEGVPLLPSAIDGTIKVCPDDLYEGFFVARLKKVR